MKKSISIIALLFLVNIQISSVLAVGLPKGNTKMTKNNPTNEVLTVAVADQVENSNSIDVVVHSKVCGKSQIVILNGKTGRIVHTSSLRLTEGENKLTINTADFPEGTVYKVILKNSNANASTVFRKEKIKNQ